VTSTSNEGETGRRAITSDTPRLVGLVVFLGGIAMIVMVFVWAYALYSSVGDELNQVAISQAIPTTNPAAGEPPSAPAEQVTVAAPTSATSLADVAAVFALKLVFLALMAWAGALVATKGVAMTRQGP